MLLLVATTAAWSADPSLPYATDRVLVRFVAPAGRAFRPVLPAEVTLQELPYARWARQHGRLPATAEPDLQRTVAARVPEGWTVTGLVEALQQRADVAYAEPDYIGTGGLVPVDPDFTQQWHHLNRVWTGGTRPADTRMVEAWEITTGSSNVLVAVLDTGLATGHAEFSGRTVAGWDFVNDDANPADDHGHGTWVTGFLAQNAGNTNRGAGVDWRCRIMPLKVLDAANSGYYSDWAAAIEYAVSNGVDVINLSAGGSSSDTTLSNAIMSAIAQGVIFVTISHNDGTSNVRFPGRMAPCITVGATTTSDVRATFSNWGSTVDLVAPGDNVVTVNPNNTLFRGSGTSFAAPQVAGVCAMLRALFPRMRQDQAERLLRAGADDQVGKAAEDTAGFDIYHGYGRLNARATLELAQTSITGGALTEQGLVVSWSAPSNAVARRPFVLERAALAGGPWSSNAAQVLQYGTNTASSLVTTASNIAFFRVSVRP